MKIKFFIVLLLGLLIGLAAGVTFPAAHAAPLGRTAVNDIWGFAPQTLTVTGAQTLTPTVSEYHLSNSALLTLTLAEINARPGDRLRLASLVVTNTTIATTNTALTATRVITQNDVIEFEYLNGQWVEVAYRDND